MVLGFDTSNYTTSVAISDGVGGKNWAHAFWTFGPASWGCGSQTRCSRM